METFEEFASTRLPALVRFAAVLTHDRGTAEDVCQEVAIRVQRDWARIAVLDHPDAYVRRMIVNEYLSWRRKWSRVIPFPTVGMDRSVPDHAEVVSERSALMVRIGRLPPQQRTVLALRYYEDMPDSEIAAILGCSESTVRGYVMRALRTLRVDLDGLEGFSRPARRAASRVVLVTETAVPSSVAMPTSLAAEEK